MRISLDEDIYGLKSFSVDDCPNFMLLTGLNGSGKSNLLKAISQGKVAIDAAKVQAGMQGNVLMYDWNFPGISSRQQFTSTQIADQISVRYQMYEEKLNIIKSLLSDPYGGLFDTVNISKDLSFKISNLERYINGDSDTIFVNYPEFLGDAVRQLIGILKNGSDYEGLAPLASWIGTGALTIHPIELLYWRKVCVTE